MNINRVVTLVFLIICTIWTSKISYRIFDKKLKVLTLCMSLSLNSLLVFKFFRLMFDESKLLWYLFYIAFIFSPNFYYLIVKYLSHNENKKSYIIPTAISCALMLFVLTNNLHEFVFRLGENGKYYNSWGYFIIVAWIMYLLLVSTIKLVHQRAKVKKDFKLLLPFLPIALGFIYTCCYVIRIPMFDILRANMPSVISFLFCIGLECTLQLDLIPNNIAYKSLFEKSKLPIKILSRNDESTIETSSSFEVPKDILEEINKTIDVKENFQLESGDQVYDINRLGNCYSVTNKDFSKIESLKREVEEKRKELKNQEEVLNKQKDLKEKLYEERIKREILEQLESKIDNKRKEIRLLLEQLSTPDEAKLNQIKMAIAYCKRMSNLIISEYNQETYDKESIQIILHELIEDAASLGIDGAINCSEMTVSTLVVSKLYDILYFVILKMQSGSILVNIIKQNDLITLNVLIDKKLSDLNDELMNQFKDIIKKIDIKQEENETLLKITI